MTIYEIEAMTYEEARKQALETWKIKEHTVFLVDCGEYFGLSALVFYGDMHIFNANDYQLHHGNMDAQELKAWYFKTLSEKLFTDAEMSAPLKSYGDYHRRINFLINYYPLRKPNVSCWGKSEDAEKEYPFFDKVTYRCFAEKTFINRIQEIDKQLDKCKAEMSNSYEYWYSAFRYEFDNYECYYAWDNKYENVAEGLVGGKLNNIQARAFEDAKRDYIKVHEEMEI